MRTDGWTERHEVANSRFSQFATTTKNRIMNNFVAGSVSVAVVSSSLDLAQSFYTFILLNTLLISAHKQLSL